VAQERGSDANEEAERERYFSYDRGPPDQTTTQTSQAQQEPNNLSDETLLLLRARFMRSWASPGSGTQTVPVP